MMTKIHEHLSMVNKRMVELMERDKVLGALDSVALEAIRLGIEGWDQMTVSVLREELRIARNKERADLGLHKSIEP